MASTNDRGDRYAAALWRLKRRGCLLALVGPVEEATAARAVDRLLGAPVRERRRLVVLAHPDAEDRWSHRLPHTDVIDRRPTTDGDGEGDADDERGAAPVADDGADVDDLDVLRERVEAAVEECRAEAPLATAEFRLIVDSVDAIADRHGVAAAVEFVTALTDLVCDVRGMAALRVRTADDRLRAALDDVVDGRIELRDGEGDAGSGAGTGTERVVGPVRPSGPPTGPDGGGPQQRIHLPGVGTSGWVPL